MLILLPFLIIGVGVSTGLCAAAGYGGILLPVMLVLFFLAAFIGSMAVAVLLLWVLSLFIDMEKPQETQPRFFLAIVNWVLGLIMLLSRIRLHVSGMEQLPEGRWLLVSNHRSNYDPIVTGWAFRHCGLAFVSKPENLRRPIVGKLIHKVGYLPIDRENDRAALRTILTAAERIRMDRMSYCIYPEGTRNPQPEMLPFRCGAFKIAQKAGVPIVIAAIRGTDDVCHRFPRATDVYLDICGVLDADTVKASKTTEIGEVVRECIISANT